MKAMKAQRNLFGLIAGIALVGCLGPSASATDRYVSLTGHNQTPFTNWWGAATDIQTAVNAATNGDTVWVSAGTYLLTNQVTVNQGVTVKGFGGPSAVIVNGGYPERTNRCFFLSGGVLDNLTITNGYARTGLAGDGDGGAVFIDGPGVVRNCLIIGNTADANGVNATGYGGGIFVNGSGTVSNCVLKFNRAIGWPSRAGAIWLWGGTVWGCTVISNTCESGGGGVDIENGVVANCHISGNSGSDHGGGGITAWNSSIRNCLIADNTSGYGGGIELASGSSVVDNCTVVSNRANRDGGGVYFLATSGVLVQNSIVWGNSIVAGQLSNYSGKSTNVSYSCTTPLPLSGSGNTAADPLFADAVSNDYRLAWNSPCIDKGTNQAWMAGATDLNGNQRIINVIVDMGAHEAMPDTDSDGIPDWWVTQHFGHPTGQSGDQSLAGDDPDGDGYTNLEEFQNGGNPLKFDVGSAYIWMAVEVGWKGVAGTNYQVQCTTNLSSGNWTNWGGIIVGNGGTNAILDSTRANERKYYRVVVP